MSLGTQLKNTEQTHSLLAKPTSTPPTPPSRCFLSVPPLSHPWTRPEGDDISEDSNLRGEKRQGKGMVYGIHQLSQAFDFTTATKHYTGVFFTLL